MSGRRGFDAALRLHLLYRPSPLIVITYRDSDELEGILADIRFQLGFGGGEVRELALSQALEQPGVAALVIAPVAEQEESVERLDALRDSLGGRSAPLVLLVPRGGAAMEKLRLSPYLESWVRGRVLDRELLEASDEHAERDAFIEHAGCSPEDFIAAVERGDTEGKYSDNMLLQRAQFLLGRAT